VEFALLVLFFLALIFGVLEMARLVYLFNTLQEVTRRAASIAASSAFDQDTQDSIRRRALFADSNGNLVLGRPITFEHLQLEYLSLSRTGTGSLAMQPITAMPADPVQNRLNCLANPYADNCIRFVRVRVCQPDAAGCTPVPYEMLFPLVNLTGLVLPRSTTTAPAQTMGTRTEHLVAHESLTSPCRHLTLNPAAFAGSGPVREFRDGLSDLVQQLPRASWAAGRPVDMTQLMDQAHLLHEGVSNSRSQINGRYLFAFMSHLFRDLQPYGPVEFLLLRRQLPGHGAAARRRLPAGQRLVALLCVAMTLPVDLPDTGLLALRLKAIDLILVTHRSRDQTVLPRRRLRLVEYGSLLGGVDGDLAVFAFLSSSCP